MIGKPTPSCRFEEAGLLQEEEAEEEGVEGKRRRSGKKENYSCSYVPCSFFLCFHSFILGLFSFGQAGSVVLGGRGGNDVPTIEP